MTSAKELNKHNSVVRNLSSSGNEKNVAGEGDAHYETV
jgi:hypothetical protein